MNSSQIISSLKEENLNDRNKDKKPINILIKEQNELLRGLIKQNNLTINLSENLLKEQKEIIESQHKEIKNYLKKEGVEKLIQPAKKIEGEKAFIKAQNDFFEKHQDKIDLEKQNEFLKKLLGYGDQLILKMRQNIDIQKELIEKQNQILAPYKKQRAGQMQCRLI